MPRFSRLVAHVLLLACGCRRAELEAPPAAEAPEKMGHLGGLHNVFRLTLGLYSGSNPEGDGGFQSLRQLGVRTVLSVDGTRPEVERARKHGLRYVHLPVGYDGVSREQAWRIARALRDLPGPIYVHCHHGQHRGPAASAAAWRCLDEGVSAERGVAFLRRAGTAAHYVGLYRAVERVERPGPGGLDRVAADFPEVAPVSAFVQTMVQMDAAFEHLTAIRKAGWKAPPDHADLDPPHEALQLAEAYHEAGRAAPKSADAEFRRWLREGEANARAMEKALRAKGQRDPAALERLWRDAGALCTRCHAKHRDGGS